MHTNILNLSLVFILISCTYNEESTASEQETLPDTPETVDVYLNPNEFMEVVPALQVGQSPPALSVDKWLKGNPLSDGFQEGKVYVVEFWASWCKPCRKSIPHLNYLQEQHAEDGLQIIAVAASEYRGSGQLEKLVSKKGDEMSYTIAYSADSAVFQNWNWAARNTGLPWTFIIDRDGKLVWWGQPFFSDFNVVLRSVLNGTYAYEDAGDINNNREELWNLQTAFWDAYVEDDLARAVEIGKTLYATGDELFYYEVASVFEILFEQDEAAAIDFLSDLSASYLINIPEGVQVLASTILNSDQPYAASYYDQALALSRTGLTLTYGQNPSMLKTMGIAHWKNEALDSARFYFQKSIETSEVEEFRSAVEQIVARLEI